MKSGYFELFFFSLPNAQWPRPLGYCCGRCIVLRSQEFLKMQGIRRNKKNGCVPTIMRFEFDVVFALSHSMVKIRKSCPEQMIFYVTEGRAWNLKSSREEVFKDYSMG